MRIVRYIAALVGLATIGFAVGDFASHPNALGAVGLVVLVGVVTFLLSHLFRPARATAPATATPAADPPPRKRRERAPDQPVWSGWSGEEAQVARQARRERNRRP